MKTKLLKIIRKRYSIVIGTKTNSKNSYLDFLVPFYIIKDSHNNWREWAFQDFESCMNQLQLWIRKDYDLKKRKEIKVWYK